MEFLLALVQVLEIELEENENFKKALQTIYGIERTERKFLDSPFGQCVKCNEYPSVSEIPFLTLRLVVPFSTKVQLQFLLNNYFSEEMSMCCSNGCCQCGKCKEARVCLRSVKRITSITDSPDILMVQLQRFACGSDGHKVTFILCFKRFLTYYQLQVTTLVTADHQLRLANFTYDLIATLDHQGSTINCGHWVTNRQTDGGNWIVCSDEEVGNDYS